jgi:hypothetical protein
MSLPVASHSPLLLDYQAGNALERRTPRWLHALLLILLLPAAVVPFIAFTYDISPLSALWEIGQMVQRGSDQNDLWLIAFLAAPFFAGLMIVFWQLRLLIRQLCSRTGRTVAFSVAGVSALMTLLFCGMGLWKMAHEGFDSESATFEGIGFGVLLLGGGCFWLARRFRASGDELAMISMHASYLANAILCLFAFKSSRPLGWWMTMWACAVMVGHTALILIISFRARRRA